MDDIAPHLLEKIQKEFDSLYRKNKKIQKLLEIINSGKGTYEEANEYAIEVGEILAKCYADSITEDTLPDGKMYYNIAKRTIEPTMLNNFDLISNVSVSVQETLNQKASIGLAVESPEINQYKIDSIINKLTSDQFNKVAFILQEPVVHFSQSIVDDTIKANAELHSRSGLHPKITRKVRGGCCKWCMNLAGTYAYPDDVPDDVYRRHDHCRCEVLYDPGEGKQVQNVHTKSWENREEDIQRRIKFSTSNVSKYADDVTAECFGTATPGKGSIEIDNGVKKAEREMAQFIFDKFGGNINAKLESTIDGTLSPDYIWNGRYWDLKTLSTEKAAYSATRHGFKQISENPGGLIMDYRYTNKNEISKILSEVDNVWHRTKVNHSDIMIIISNDNIKVYRYKKE